MLREFIPAAVAAVSLAGLAFAPSASADSLSSSTLYGCAAGDFCMYSTEVISAGTKIGIGRGETWPDGGFSSVEASPYKNVRSLFNNGLVDPKDHVRVVYVYGNGGVEWQCIGRATDSNPAAGHVWPKLRAPVTVIQIKWTAKGCPT
ncbi:hypothetical protein DMB42_24665 [Nonomuraea sp. WAC 01424]|uniref:hypothetical protein n=1 Tax=Nonomuraea sp. WAC 01424 TaxID=2203200 RepID=UPI000F78A9FF|nr:hypothetical protein [Nonomuraea sp. WAC 01424]RSN06484.1 hypothetical protein DMB42_24665 [Nonomuraea sp. WAC 01424]